MTLINCISTDKISILVYVDTIVSINAWSDYKAKLKKKKQFVA